ncbi:MAG TPA: methyl-accepting chemotaxis protein [Phenylobacterium sp.]|uniref:methyl-accepting chemotaxis protein n=1 Tax=Phenylobacterium sp. TaxID=1871053 RepID=UPI002D387423|nr:methyl-accepting chemotaxis protein [Phenylobacterium sp.]HZZ69419.1 methyl-accepting chemotaxis protein [Phenylobacterium sp.]
MGVFKLDFINSRMSLGARLATLSFIFCVPIALVGTMYVTQSLKDTGATAKEISGAEYLTAIWPGFEAAASDSKDDSDRLGKVRAKFDSAFSTGSAADAFVGGATGAQRLEAGANLMGAVADGSGLTLDPDLDSFYVMLPVSQDLPALLQATEAMEAAAALAVTDPSRGPRLAESFQSVRIASKNVAEHLDAAMKGNASGDTRKALADEAESLKKTSNALLAHKAAMLAGAGPETASADKDALEHATSSAWNASAKELNRLLAARNAKAMQALTMNLAGIALALAVATILGLVIAKGLSGRIGDLLRIMDKLIGGDASPEVPHLTDTNETGRIAATVAAFKQSLIDGARMRQEAAELEAKAETQRHAAEADRVRTAEEQAVVVGDVAEGLMKLSSGVLTHRLNRQFAPAYEKLRNDFNAAIEGLQNALVTVAENTGGVRTASTEISQASDNLSRRTEQQAASLEETAAALDEITATVRKTAEGAGQARDAVGLARADAERSGVVVRDAVAAMAEIENSAQQISQIIGVIDEIAFQTNLLALNAGVEAARAGDAGRGFAVVASEVRALAQRSADAAKEIKALISASSQQVERGVNLVGETGKVLERIVTQVTQINGVVTEIAASAEEQSTGLQQVNTAVNQMDQVTQQNAAMVEEATAASHALTSEADTLAALISRFELGGQAKPRAAFAHAAPAPQRRAVPQMKTTGARGGAAPAFATQEDSWDEF